MADIIKTWGWGFSSNPSILPNEIIFRIIREADGGRYTHQKKMMMKNGVFDMITGDAPIYLYRDGEENLCPQYIYEEHSGNVGTIEDSEDETDSEDDSDEE